MGKFSLEYMFSVFPLVLEGVPITIYIATVSFIVGFIISIFLAMVRYYNIFGLNLLAKIYISFFRAVPALVLLFFIFLVVPRICPLFKGYEPATYTIVALSLFIASYMAENFRAAFDAIDKGQNEACMALGMTKLQAMRRILFPQAFKIALPSMGNNYITQIKGAALGFVVGVPDVLAIAKTEAAVSFRFFEAYLVVMLIYWGVVILFEQILKIFEKKISSAY